MVSGNQSTVLGKDKFLSLQLELIQRAPIRPAFVVWLGGSFQPGRSRAGPAAFAVAVRMGRQVQEKVFADVGHQVDDFRAGQLMVNGECGNFDIEGERFEAPDTFQLDWLRQMAGDPEGAFGNAGVERITERTRAGHIFRLKLGNWKLLFAFQVETISLNVAEMDFHS